MFGAEGSLCGSSPTLRKFDVPAFYLLPLLVAANLPPDPHPQLLCRVRRHSRVGAKWRAAMLN